MIDDARLWYVDELEAHEVLGVERPLTTQEVRSVIDTLEYKPGHEITVLGELEHSPHRLLVTASLPDSRDPAGAKVDVCIYNDVSELQSSAAVLAAVRHLLQSLEWHEIDEWLRFKGTRTYLSDPHPGRGG